MSKWPACWRNILILLLGGVWMGCVPIGDSPVDEEKDPNFIEGRNLINAMDYKGAVEAFERALQANPRNAAAHLELGLLYQEKLGVIDPLAAAYHYQKHLQLRPKSDYAAAIKPRIEACKMDLSKSVSFGVVTREVHRDLEKMTNELALSRQQNEALRRQLAAKPMILTQWMTLRVTNLVTAPAPTNRAAYIAPAPTNSAASPATSPRPQTNAVQQANRGGMQQRAAQASLTRVPAPQPTMKKYVVRSGENMSQIARRFGVSVAQLKTANPAIEPRRLRAGQTLNIPNP